MSITTLLDNFVGTSRRRQSHASDVTPSQRGGNSSTTDTWHTWPAIGETELQIAASDRGVKVDRRAFQHFYKISHPAGRARCSLSLRAVRRSDFATQSPIYERHTNDALLSGSHSPSFLNCNGNYVGYKITICPNFKRPLDIFASIRLDDTHPGHRVRESYRSLTSISERIRAIIRGNSVGRPFGLELSAGCERINNTSLST